MKKVCLALFLLSLASCSATKVKTLEANLQTEKDRSSICLAKLEELNSHTQECNAAFSGLFRFVVACSQQNGKIHTIPSADGSVGLGCDLPKSE